VSLLRASGPSRRIVGLRASGWLRGIFRLRGSGSSRRIVGKLGVLALVASLALLGGCRRRHVPVDAAPELGYPSCPDDPGVVVARGHIRSGPVSNDQGIVERFELRRTSCGYTFQGRQESPGDVSDVEARYDANLSPRWAWRRTTLGASPRPDGAADIRRYELRTGDVFIKRRDAEAAVTLERLLPGGRMTVPAGARVGALIAPGRGILTVWLRRAKLKVGDKTDDLVLDLRGALEALEIGSLERDEDRFEPSLGKSVRVYTFFGQETVFADDQDVVIGDLSGLRPSDALSTPEPEPLPTFGGADPVHTP
jgi:hypothetical protein